MEPPARPEVLIHQPTKGKTQQSLEEAIAWESGGHPLPQRHYFTPVFPGGRFGRLLSSAEIERAEPLRTRLLRLVGDLMQAKDEVARQLRAAEKALRVVDPTAIPEPTLWQDCE